MKTTKFKLILIFFIIPILIFPQNLSMEEAINHAMHNNPKIKQYAEKLTQKEYGEYSAWGNFLPKINIEGNLTHLNDAMEINLNPIRDAMIQLHSGSLTEISNIYHILSTGMPLGQNEKYLTAVGIQNDLDSKLPEFKETLKEQNYRTLTVTGIQPLFAGGKLIAAKKYASAQKLAADYELKNITDQVIKEVEINYLNVILLQDIVDTRKMVLEGISIHKQNAQKLVEEGVIPNYHLLRAEVALVEAERNLSDDSNNLDLAKIALNSSIGNIFTEIPELSDTIIFNNYELIADSIMKDVLSNNPLLGLIDQKKNEADANYIKERGEMLPTLAAFGKYELYPEYLSALEPRWAVGLQLKFNLFNGLKNYMNLQSAEHLQHEVRYAEEELKKNLSLLTNKLINEYNKSKQRYIKLDASVELAEENLRMNKKRFETGMGTSLEVIDAQIMQEKILLDRSMSVIDFYKSLAEIFYIAGQPEKLVTILN